MTDILTAAQLDVLRQEAAKLPGVMSTKVFDDGSGWPCVAVYLSGRLDQLDDSEHSPDEIPTNLERRGLYMCGRTREVYCNPDFGFRGRCAETLAALKRLLAAAT